MLNKIWRFMGHAIISAICTIVIVLPMELLKLIYGLMGCRTTITEEEVYGKLSCTEWKSGLQLSDEIRMQRLERQPYAAMLD